MKYLYKKTMKKLLMLFFLLPAALTAMAQVPGTPYGLTALSPATIPSGSGSFSGRTCFDVAQANDAGECGNLTSRKNETLTANGSRADFSNTITRNQTYTFTPSGTVSNVRFYFVEASPYEGQLIASMTGGNPGNNITSAAPVTCSVVYRSDLNGKASGTTNANALRVDIYAVYNDNAGGTGTDKSVKLTAMIKDCACCGAYTTSGSWLSFMCYNLGADPSLTTPDQIKNAPPSQTYGYFYQWGKRKTWPATGGVSGWSSSPNTNLDGAGGNSDAGAWGDGGPKTAGDPCPAGWRVPTILQWQSIYGNLQVTGDYDLASANDWTYVIADTEGTQIGTYLYLPDARSRTLSGGIESRRMGYWSRSAAGGTLRQYFVFRLLDIPFAGVGELDSSAGLSLRCVAE